MNTGSCAELGTALLRLSKDWAISSAMSRNFTAVLDRKASATRNTRAPSCSES